jgi:D-alanine-D-alanine ligase
MENVAVVFGGRSVEHEVSVITGMQIMENMDKSKYNPIPLYITKDGRFLSGDSLKNIANFKHKNFDQAIEVFFKGFAGDHNLYTITSKKSSFLGPKVEQVELYKKIDIVFPALHGTNGEDGTFQGMLEMLSIPYVGCGVMSAAVGMDKVVMKEVFASNGINMTEYFSFYRNQWSKQKDEIIKKAEEIGYNLFIKPANLGSSIGISRAQNKQELIDAIELAMKYDSKILVEKAVENPREINIAVMGQEDDVIVSACEEPLGWKGLLKYEDKYIQGSKSSGKTTGMKGQNKALPADLKESVQKEIEDLAKRAFMAIDAVGDARIDFLLDGDNVYVNEINTLPGSIAFYLWEVNGISFEDLITRLIILAKEKHSRKKENLTTYDVDLLNMTNYGAKIQ